MAKVSPIGRVSYPSVFKPNVYEGKENFQLTLIFDKNADLAEMESQIKEAVEKKWGKNPPKKLKLPIKDGDEKEQKEYEGKRYVTFKSQPDKPPQVVNADKAVITENSGLFYAGCYARVSYGVYTYDKGGNVGVGISLHNVQKVKDGDRFDGSTTADDDFDSVGEAADGSDLF